MPFSPPPPGVPFAEAFPPTVFDNLINWGGMKMLWMKGHACPCAGANEGPNYKCQWCAGRGIYWDPPKGPFIVLMTFITWIGRNVDVGAQTDPQWGLTFEGEPILTIPQTTDPVLWANCGVDDAFIEVDALMNFNATLRVGLNETVPHYASLTIPLTGAVTVEDPATNNPVSGIAYTVSGSTVLIDPPNSYPEGTSYVVSYSASPIYVAYGRYGGLTHVRPFGQGLLYPKRFKLQILDYFLRNKMGVTGGGTFPST